jgi:two-component system, NtrC family, response regulator AtoC
MLPERKQVLIVDDEPNLRKILSAQLTRDGYDALTAEDGEQGLHLLREHHIDLIITDLKMPKVDGMTLLKRALEIEPELPVVLITAHGTIDTAVEALKRGAFDFVTKPFDKDEVRQIVAKALKTRELRGADATPAPSGARFGIIGTSQGIAELCAILERVADTPTTALITGESGTGKELVAQAIHQNSPRAKAPFVKLHCAALAETLLESELFGHERGAFTGAVGRRDGRFKQADGGTLFLDEIGEISPAIQVKLLRFLQERTFERVGGNETVKVDVRIITATNRDLNAEAAAGKFREDLFYRLNVVNIEMPPLRARPSDLLPLATFFLHRFAKENGKRIDGFADDAIERIGAYRWPGNVRELENVMERAVVLCEGPKLTAKNLPAGVGASSRTSVRIPGSTMDEIERNAILATLEACGGRTTQAAQMLDISVRKIQYKLHEYGVTLQRTTVTKPTSDS